MLSVKKKLLTGNGSWHYTDDTHHSLTTLRTKEYMDLVTIKNKITLFIKIIRFFASTGVPYNVKHRL